MKRGVGLILLILVLAGAAAWIWPTRYRYEKIIVDQDTYIVRINRISGHADILVPEQGWVPAEDPWNSSSDGPPGNTHT
jgi:hypothetical protein